MLTSISIIVPTYHEAESLPHLIKALGQLKEAHQLDMELLIMDDNSQDGTEELISKLSLDWIRLVVRRSGRGLSAAVIEGFSLATREVVVVMDADLSHPVDTIPVMLNALEEGYDFVLGSRYIAKASTDKKWSTRRRINSYVAGWLSAPLTPVKDSMSGFFAFRKVFLDKTDSLNPVGYKIALELLVKSRSKNILEVPIHFSDRQWGKSKLTIWEQLKYIKHLRRLYLYKYPEFTYLSQFLVVGFSGVFVNLFVLTMALLADFNVNVSIFLGIAISMIWNFSLDRRFVFPYARHKTIFYQFIGFICVCIGGAFLNYQTALKLLHLYPDLLPQVAELGGILVGTSFNYLLSRFLIFRGAP